MGDRKWAADSGDGWESDCTRETTSLPDPCWQKVVTGFCSYGGKIVYACVCDVVCCMQVKSARCAAMQQC